VETARPALLQNLLAVPIVGAPLAGGPTTPALAAAVCEAGGLGFLAAGYKTAVALADDINALRRLTRRPFGVNVF
jgi:nitronate monooxygenase